MKRVFIMSTVFFLFSTEGISQNNDRRGFSSFNLGISLPTGNYKSTNFSNSESGYASTGFCLDFTLGYKIRPKLGLTALLRSQANSLNVGAYAQDLANYFGRNNPALTTSVSVESSAYSIGGIMGGGYGSFLMKDKLSFEPRILIGFSSAILPAMTTETYESGTKLTTFIREQSSTFAFSYIIGTGAKFDMSEKICIMLNMDFYSAKAEWYDVKEVGIGHITGNTEIFEFDYSQKFSTLNICAGVGLRF